MMGSVKGYSVYHPCPYAAASCNSKNVEHSWTDNSPNSDVSLRDEGADHVDEEFWCWRGSRHECCTGNIIRHI